MPKKKGLNSIIRVSLLAKWIFSSEKPGTRYLMRTGAKKNKLPHRTRRQRPRICIMAFVIFHIILLEQGVFLNRITGQVAIVVVLIAVLARALVLVLKKPEVHNNPDDLVLKH